MGYINRIYNHDASLQSKDHLRKVIGYTDLPVIEFNRNKHKNASVQRVLPSKQAQIDVADHKAVKALNEGDKILIAHNMSIDYPWNAVKPS